MPLVEVGVLFYMVSLAVAVVVGWFARAAFGSLGSKSNRESATSHRAQGVIGEEGGRHQ